MLCDIIITIALTTSFRMKMDGISRYLLFLFSPVGYLKERSRTNAMLQTLTVNAVNRGMLTATCAVLDVTLVREKLISVETTIDILWIVPVSPRNTVLLYRPSPEWKTCARWFTYGFLADQSPVVYMNSMMAT